jgi:hypothetical protein
VKRLSELMLFGVLACMGGQRVFAQDTGTIIYPPRMMPIPEPKFKRYSNLIVTAEAIMYSRQVPSAMLYPFYTGGRISNELIENTANRMENNKAALQGYSLLQVDFQDYAGLLFGAKKGKSWWALNYRYTTLYGAAFDQAAFNLVFRGNAPFAGTTLETNNLQINSISWNSLGASRHGRIGKYRYVAGASWVFMRNYQHLDLKQGSLYTSAFGDSLQLGYNLDYTRKDRNSNGLYTLNHGAALNFSLGGVQRIKLKNSRFIGWELGLRDVGLVAAGSSMARYTRDSGLAITGWHVPFTPYGIDSNASFQGYFDSLLTRMDPQRAAVRGNIWLPALFEASFSTYLGGRQTLYGQLQHRFFPGFIPRAAIGYRIRLKNENWAFSAQLAYGGTRSGDVGLFAYWYPRKDLGIRFMIPSVEGLLMPGRTGGAGAGIQLSWALN